MTFVALIGLMWAGDAVAQKAPFDVYEMGDSTVSAPQWLVWDREDKGKWAGIRVTDPEIAWVIQDMAERSPAVAERLQRIEDAPYPVVISTAEHVEAFQEGLGGMNFPDPAFEIHYVENDTVIFVLVGLRWTEVKAAAELGLISEREAREDLERMLVHELVVHVGSVAPLTSMDGMCADPPAFSYRMGCSVMEENLFMHSLGWQEDVRRMHVVPPLHYSKKVMDKHKPRTRELVGGEPLGAPISFIGPMYTSSVPKHLYEAVERLLFMGKEKIVRDVITLVNAGREEGLAESVALVDGLAFAMERLNEMGVYYHTEVVHEPLEARAGVADSGEFTLGLYPSQDEESLGKKLWRWRQANQKPRSQDEQGG